MSFIKSESIGKLVLALLESKRQFSPVLKQSENPFFKKNGQPSKYADLATAIHATEDALMGTGLVVTQFPVNEGERVGVLTLLIHESGEYCGESFTLPLGDKQNAQTGVAAVTYARRTGYLAALGIAAEDDDGNTAAGRITADDEPSYSHLDSRPARSAQAAPKAKAAAPVSAKTSTAPAIAPSTVTPTSASSAAAPSAQIEPAQAAETGDPTLPNEAELTEYRKKFIALADDLSAKGKLTSSKGLPLNVKVRVFLLHTVGAADAAHITKAQWDKFFGRVDATRAQGDEGLIKLAGLVNEANGIAPKNKK